MRKSRLFLGTAVVGLLISACGGNKSSEEIIEDKVGLADTQTITISTPSPIATMDTTQILDKNTFTMAQHLFEGLYRFDEESTPVPGLAEKVTISEDGLTYTFTLRDTIKWSNGEPITADDFVYAWKKLINPETLAPNAYLLDSVKNSYEIRNGNRPVSEMGIAAPNEKEFVVELTHAQPSFLTVASIAWLAPQNQKYVEEQGKTYATDSEHLIYSGPFVLAKWEASSDTWTLKKNPNYYAADEVNLEEIDVSTIKEDSTGINLYQTGGLDLTLITEQNVQQYTDDPGYVSHTEIASTYVDFNKKAGTPLANVNVRKAIAQAIDKEALTASVLNDGSTPLNGLIPKKLYTNPETAEDFRAFSGDYLVQNRKQAQESWKKAQAELGDKVKLSLLVVDENKEKKVAEYVKAQLEETLPGVELTINPQPRNNVIEARKKKEYDCSLSGWIAGSNELDSYFNLYASGSSYNYGGYKNEDYDTLVKEARTTDANNVQKQFDEYQLAEELLLNQDAAQVPLYQSARSYLVSPKIKGMTYHLYGDYFNFREAYLEK